MARKAAAPTRRVASNPGPRDQSRGTGPAVPESVASVRAAPMYDPDPEAETDLSAANQHMGAGEFHSSVAQSADHYDEDISSDYEVTEAAAADTSSEGGPTPAELARIRAMRKPLGAMSQKLALPARRGYHRHWFNDTAGRVDEAQANGWAFVKGTDGKNIKRCVGTGRDKGALWAYAMELPLVFWQEDQNARNQAASAVMDNLKSNPFRAEKGAVTKADRGKFYDPSETGPVQIAKH